MWKLFAFIFFGLTLSPGVLVLLVVAITRRLDDLDGGAVCAVLWLWSWSPWFVRVSGQGMSERSGRNAGRAGCAWRAATTFARPGHVVPNADLSRRHRLLRDHRLQWNGPAARLPEVSDARARAARCTRGLRCAQDDTERGRRCNACKAACSVGSFHFFRPSGAFRCAAFTNPTADAVGYGLPPLRG